MKEILAIGVVVLFIGTSAISSAIDLDKNKDIKSLEMIKHSIISTIHGDNILYVGGSGPENYTKIQDAIDNSSDGDTVFVFSNINPYVEFLNIDKAINLIGQDKNSTIIDCKQDKHVVRITSDNVKILDFTIKNSFPRDSFKNGISINSVENIKITNCNIIDNEMEGIWVHSSSKNITISYSCITSNGHYGIEFMNTDDIYVIGNEIFNNPVHGICFSYCKNINIENNNISSNGGCGILFSSVNPFSKISNNLISNNGEDGIYLLYRCNNANITGNRILNNGEKGILIKGNSHNATISENIVMGNNHDWLNTEHGGGICIYGSPDNIITRNIVKYNIHDDIYISGSIRTQITWNEINSGYSENLIMKNCFYSKVYNNNFWSENNNKVAVVFSKWGGVTDFFYNMIFLNTVKFNQNYWNRPRLYPKPIKTSYNFKFGPPDFPGLSLKIPFFIFDKNPSQKPYVIGG